MQQILQQQVLSPQQLQVLLQQQQALMLQQVIVSPPRALPLSPHFPSTYPVAFPVGEWTWQAKWDRIPPGSWMISVVSAPLKDWKDATCLGLRPGDCPMD